MKPRAYYNEIEPYACDWLENLMERGLIMEGDIDRRSIKDVLGRDLRGYTRCHFFAGLGGWDYALQLADWPDEREVWTGSCPCQPFSAAGQQRGTGDTRHLWPEFHRLIAQRRPATVFGEQVASKLGRGWLAGVRADVEALGYAVGAADLCAAGLRAPHIRQRLWFVADAVQSGRSQGRPVSGDRPAAGGVSALAHGHGHGHGQGAGRGDAGEMRGIQETQRQSEHGAALPRGSGELGELAHSSSTGLEVLGEQPSRGECAALERSGAAGELGDAQRNTGDTRGFTDEPGESDGTPRAGTPIEFRRSGMLGFWDAYELIPCRDGKARRIEPGSFPLANGVQARVAKLRALGNAIVPQVAAEFIKAYALI